MAHHEPTPDDALNQMQRHVPRYSSIYGIPVPPPGQPLHAHLPEDAFELPAFEQRPAAPLSDAQQATRLRNCAEELAFYISEAKQAGLTVDIAWSSTTDKPSIIIVREF